MFFASFWILSLTPFNNKSECFISSLDVFSAVVPEPNISLCIPVSAADAAAVTPNGIKTLLANGLITFFI